MQAAKAAKPLRRYDAGQVIQWNRRIHVYKQYPFKSTVMKSDLKKIIEEIALKKIMHKFPEASHYTSKIKFNHTEHKASMNLDQLPPALARQIEEMFE